MIKKIQKLAHLLEGSTPSADALGIDDDSSPAKPPHSTEFGPFLIRNDNPIFVGTIDLGRLMAT